MRAKTEEEEDETNEEGCEQEDGEQEEAMDTPD